MLVVVVVVMMIILMTLLILLATEQKEKDSFLFPASKADLFGAAPESKKYTYEKAPEFTAKLQNRSVIEGTQIRLMCSVQGAPNPRITWYKDDQEIGGIPYLTTVSLSWTFLGWLA